MKPLLIPLVLLCASTAYAQQPTPISFETIVSLDKFRITNTSSSASLHELFIRPSADVTPVLSHPDDMWWAHSPPWPGDDRIGFQLIRFYPGRWVDFVGTWEAGSQLSAMFAESPSQRGFIYAPIENGTFEGWTVPEPGTWLMGLVGVAVIVATRRRGTKAPLSQSP